MPGHAPLLGHLVVTLTAFPPDKRRRDLDNLPKVVLDSLTKAGVWKDDSQIQRLTIQWGGMCPGGDLEVEIEEIDPVAGSAGRK
jgi:crossover junction endodeoxyribonuclease RusA